MIVLVRVYRNMKQGIIFSPPEIIDVGSPLIFLAGPIQSALNWRLEAIEIIHKLAPEINIANPERDYLERDFDYGKQVDWETHYLKEAAKKGVILFWIKGSKTRLEPFLRPNHAGRIRRMEGQASA